MVEFLQSYWVVIMVGLGVIVAAAYLWFTGQRKRIEEFALLLAKQVVTLVVSTAKQVISEIPDVYVTTKAKQLYAALPAWAKRIVSEQAFTEWALIAWQRFKAELERGADVATALNKL